MSLPGHVEFDLAAKLFTTLFPSKKEIDGDDPRMVAIAESFKAAIQAEYDCSTWAEDMEKYQTILGREIARCRFQQDRKWGGPEHDDTHVQHDWIRFIREHTDYAESHIRFHSDEAYEKSLIDVAALCVAALQSFRRKLLRVAEVGRVAPY